MGEIMNIAIREKSRVFDYLHEFAIGLCGAILIAVSAPISYHLPFTVVPITLQVHVALFVALLLGPTRGPLSVVTFLSMGAMGYPVFSSGFVGSSALMGPTAGYLWGYFAAALLITRFRPSSFKQMVIAMSLGNAVIYLWGAAYLSGFIGVGNAIKFGVLPFLVGDICKILLFSKLAGSRSVDSALERFSTHR